MSIDKDKLPRVQQANPRLFDVPNAVHAYIENGQSIIVTFYNSASASFQITGRIQNETQNVILFGKDFTPTTTGEPSRVIIPVPNGFLISLTVSVSSGSVVYGQTFVTVALHQGLLATSTPILLLLENYITNGSMLSFPTSPSALPIQGNGGFTVLHPGDPAAGAIFNGNFPDFRLVKIISVGFILVTDANVGNRFPYLDLVCETGILPLLIHTELTAAIPASTTAKISYAQNALPVDYISGGTDRAITMRMPEAYATSTALAASGNLQIRVQGMQATDQISAIRIQLQSWVNP
ncbi:MAG: hypothetical protein WC716_16810 [Chitinophagaceae bacterium]|jgi:hypothetical protein